MQFGQLLLIQVGLLVHPGLVAKLHGREKEEGSEELIPTQ